MYGRNRHFMQQCFDRMRIQLIQKEGVIMMNIGLYVLIDLIAQEYRFFAEVDLIVHGENISVYSRGAFIIFEL